MVKSLGQFESLHLIQTISMHSLMAWRYPPDTTGSGIGSLLMKQAITFIKERGFKNVELGVIAANVRAGNFYESHGWELVEEFTDGIEGVPISIYRLHP
jgi:predicted GNAT family N-acyltransferase